MSEDAPHYGPAQFLCSVPAGTRFTPHPSGNGLLLAHPDYPLRWVRVENGKALDEIVQNHFDGPIGTRLVGWESAFQRADGE